MTDPAAPPREIAVAAAVVVRDGRILIAQRANNQDHPGQWEFPGGKLHAHETAEACLVRELAEELGVHAEVGRCLHRCTHDYPEYALRVHLDFHAATLADGEPTAHEHAALAWVAPQDLATYPILEADRKFIAEVAAGRIPL